jgi:hypothetical protein
LIARFVVISRLKREGRVDQVKVHVTDSQALATRVERRFDPFWPMIGVPQLRRDEDILTRDGCVANSAANDSPTSRSFR